MEVTVVIPARNAASTIGDQLAALARQRWSGEWEVLVVDNGSSDGTDEEIEAHRDLLADRLRVVHSHRAGACFARNLGISLSRTDHVAFVDADDVVGDGWLAAMASALRRFGFVTGPLELDRLNPEWLAASRGRAAERAAPSFYGIFPYAHGCNLGVHRRLWEEVGGLDEEMVATEDIDLSLRMWRAGSPAVFEPDAVVHYRYRTAPGELWRQGLRYGRYRPLVARRLIEAGHRRPGRLAGWKSWLQLVGYVPRAGSVEGRALLAWTAGNRLGHVLGSLEHRTLLL